MEETETRGHAAPVDNGQSERRSGSRGAGDRRRTIGAVSFAALAAFLASAGPALALDKVTFGLNWLADPEAGGYYQAVVDGTYAKYGLDVTIQPSSPEGNGGMLLLTGKIDFFQGGDLLGDFLAEERNVPIVAVAADFQKDPQIFMSHPGVGLDKWTELPKASPAFVSAGGLYSFYAWMVKGWGFKASRRQAVRLQFGAVHREQTLDPGGLSDVGALRDRAAGPLQAQCLPARRLWILHLLVADRSASRHGQANPDLVQRFVNASAIGWRDYLYGDNAKANAAIKRANPGMTDGQIAYSVAKLKEYGIVDSGDALKLGIGAMTDARVKDFFDEMVKVGLVKPDIDYKKVYTLQFVDKGVGVEPGRQ